MRDTVWRNIVQVDEFPEVGVSIQCTFLDSLGDGWHGRAERSAPQQLRRGGRESFARGTHRGSKENVPDECCRCTAGSELESRNTPARITSQVSPEVRPGASLACV